jgi:hypothetical protein
LNTFKRISSLARLVARSEAPAGQGPAATRSLETPAQRQLAGRRRSQDSLAALAVDSLSPRWLRGAHTQHSNPLLIYTARSARLLLDPPHLTCFSLSFLSLFSLSLSLSVSLTSPQGIRDSLLPSPPVCQSTHRHALFTRHPALYTCQWRLQRLQRLRGSVQGRRGVHGVRSLSPSTTPDAGPRPREAWWRNATSPLPRKEGSGNDCQHRSRQTRSAHRRLFNTIHHFYIGDGRSVAFNED